MPVDVVAPLNRIVAVLTNAPVSVQQVYVGVPAQPEARSNAYVALASWRVPDRPPGIGAHEVDYFVGFAYRVGDDVAAAERDMAAKVALFMTAMLAERRTKLGGTVASLDAPDFSLAREPQYAPFINTEFRVFVGLVRTTQQEIF